MKTGEQYKEEWWDIYTWDREKTGRTHRRGDKMKEGEYHLVVHVCIFNSDNRLLIQQRQPFKKGWPNMWDLSVGGSAVTGDTSSQAAERETFEELGIRLDLSGKRPNFTINFSDGFDDYYIVEKDIDISEMRLQEEEVRQVRWVCREEVMRMQEQGIMVPYWFLDKIFEMRGTYDYDAHGDRSHKLRFVHAGAGQIESWMSLMEIACQDDEAGLKKRKESCRESVLEKMESCRAVCALDGNVVVGAMFTAGEDTPYCPIIHPEYTGKGIAEQLIAYAQGLDDRVLP